MKLSPLERRCLARACEMVQQYQKINLIEAAKPIEMSSKLHREFKDLDRGFCERAIDFYQEYYQKRVV